MILSWDNTSEIRVHERGSISIVALCVSVVLLSATCTLATLGHLFVQQHETESAADLAALAGAQHVINGAQEACINARRVASFNGTELIDCRCDVSSVVVVVGQEVQPSVLRRTIPMVSATAKAGY